MKTAKQSRAITEASKLVPKYVRKAIKDARKDGSASIEVYDALTQPFTLKMRLALQNKYGYDVLATTNKFIWLVKW